MNLPLLLDWLIHVEAKLDAAHDALAGIRHEVREQLRREQAGLVPLDLEEFRPEVTN